MKTDLFQSYGHCWVFQICWHIECSTFTASSFRIGNSSTGITSPPLSLFVVMLPKAHLTSHSRMSGLGESSHHHAYLDCDLFCTVLLVCSCHHHFLISSASVRSIPFLSFIVPSFAWNVSLVSLIFLKRSLVFPILLFSCISVCWSLRKAFLSLLAILWSSALRCLHLSFPPLPSATLLSQLFVRQITILLFCMPFSWGWSWSLTPVQCHESQSIGVLKECLFIYQKYVKRRKDKLPFLIVKW